MTEKFFYPSQSSNSFKDSKTLKEIKIQKLKRENFRERNFFLKLFLLLCLFFS